MLLKQYRTKFNRILGDEFFSTMIPYNRFSICFTSASLYIFLSRFLFDQCCLKHYNKTLDELLKKNGQVTKEDIKQKFEGVFFLLFYLCLIITCHPAKDKFFEETTELFVAVGSEDKPKYFTLIETCYLR